MKAVLIRLITPLLFWSCPWVFSEEAEYIFSIGSKAPGRVAYEAELLQHLLDVSSPTHGKASLKLDDRKLATLRLWNEAHDGKNTHIVTSSNWQALENTPFEIIRIPIPIQNGLLGYRKCLALESSLHEINGISDSQTFRKLVVGQAEGWRDVNRYQESNIPVVVSPRYENLVPMLFAKRFTCLPLGILEVDAIAEKNEGVAIAEQLIIFYKLEVYIGVTAKLPELASRLHEGLKEIKANGEFDTLFYKHYRQAIDQLNEGERKVFFLKEAGDTQTKADLIHRHPVHVIDSITPTSPVTPVRKK